MIYGFLVTPAEIEALDIDGLFDELKLGENLSPNRHFGIYAVVDLMKSQAAGETPSPQKASRH